MTKCEEAYNVHLMERFLRKHEACQRVRAKIKVSAGKSNLEKLLMHESTEGEEEDSKKGDTLQKGTLY